MNRMRNKPNLAQGLILCILLLTSCKGNEESTIAIMPSAHSDVAAKTQALLLTQPFEYDNADKNKITGDYISKSKITIPQNLATQSKWIMFEGPVLENDLVAYRYYADSRHRFDIYGKTVSDLVMDTVSWDYHDIMDWGSDILKVGNSLGLGSPAIYYQDSIYTLSDCANKEIEVLITGAHQSSIRTTFSGLQIDGQAFDLIQDWSIEAGQPWSEIKLKVINGSLPEGMQFATGIVKHLPEIDTGTSNSHIFYAMNWGQQSFHKENMGMAILCDNKYGPSMIDDKLSHVVTFERSSEVVYRFLSVWEKDLNNVTTSEAFTNLVTNIKFTNN